MQTSDIDKKQYQFPKRICLVLYGRTGSGKSWCMRDILIGQNQYIHNFQPEDIYIFAKHCGSKNNPLHDVIQYVYENNSNPIPSGNIVTSAKEFESLISDRFELAVKLENDQQDEKIRPALFIGDDGQNQLNLKKNSIFDIIATEGRHTKISVMLALQYFKSISPVFRTNATHSIIFDTGSSAEFSKIRQELAPICITSKRFSQVYSRCLNSSEYGFMLIDQQEKDKTKCCYNSMTSRFHFES